MNLFGRCMSFALWANGDGGAGRDGEYPSISNGDGDGCGRGYGYGSGNGGASGDGVGEGVCDTDDETHLIIPPDACSHLAAYRLGVLR